MKKIICLLLFTLCFSTVYSQNQGVITGTVKDKNTQEALIAVVVTLKGADTLKATTDENGVFKITADVGRYNLETYYIGYRNFYSFNINIDRKSTRLNSSHVRISYAVFCLKKKKKKKIKKKQ